MGHNAAGHTNRNMAGPGLRDAIHRVSQSRPGDIFPIQGAMNPEVQITIFRCGYAMNPRIQIVSLRPAQGYFQGVNRDNVRHMNRVMAGETR